MTSIPIHLPHAASAALIDAAAALAKNLQLQIMEMHRDEQREKLLEQIDSDVAYLIQYEDGEVDMRAIEAFDRIIGYLREEFDPLTGPKVKEAISNLAEAAGLKP